MKIPDIIKKCKERLTEFDDPNINQYMDDIRDYLVVGDLLPPTINFENPKTIRRAQKALTKMERYLDVIVPLHHKAKRVLQIISSVEYQLLGALVREGTIPKNASGPVQRNILASHLPLLGSVKSRWESLDKICTQAQQRIASARESIKLQNKLDDNLRWAQDRQPS